MKQYLKTSTFFLKLFVLKTHLNPFTLLLAVFTLILDQYNLSFHRSYISLCVITFLFYKLSFWLSQKITSKPLYVQSFLILIIISLHTFLLQFIITDNYPSLLHFNRYPFPTLFETGFLLFLSAGIFISANTVSVLQANIALKKLNQRIILENEELRMNFLRAQMNPHFVFNCLVNLSDTIRLGQTDAAIRYNNAVSKLLRYQVENADKKIISLAEELKWLKQYIEVEMHRQPGLFDYNIECGDVDTHELFIPPMILQPFVENSIQHAFIPNRNAIRGKLIIRILQTTNDMYYVEIEDNGRNYKLNLEKKLKPNNKSIAIKNIRERIQLLKFTSSFSITLNNKFNTTGHCVRLEVCMQQ